MEQNIMSINLLPWRKARKKRETLFVYNLTLISILFIIIGLLWLHGWLVSQTQKMSLMPAIPIDHSHSISIILREINQHSKLIMSTIDDIAQQLPSQSQLTRLLVKNDLFKIEGNSINTQTLTLFMHHLHKIRSIKSVTLNNISKQVYIHFSIQVSI